MSSKKKPYTGKKAVIDGLDPNPFDEIHERAERMEKANKKKSKSPAGKPAKKTAKKAKDKASTLTDDKKRAVLATVDLVEKEPELFAGWDELVQKGKKLRARVIEEKVFRGCPQSPDQATTIGSQPDRCQCTDTSTAYTMEELARMNDATLDEVKKVNRSVKCPGQVTKEESQEKAPVEPVEIGYDIPDYVMNDIIHPAPGALLESDIKVNEEFVLRRVSRISDCMVCINIGRNLDEVGSGMRIAYTRREGKATYSVHAEFNQVTGIDSAPNAKAVYEYLANLLGLKK